MGDFEKHLVRSRLKSLLLHPVPENPWNASPSPLAGEGEGEGEGMVSSGVSGFFQKSLKKLDKNPGP